MSVTAHSGVPMFGKSSSFSAASRMPPITFLAAAGLQSSLAMYSFISSRSAAADGE